MIYVILYMTNLLWESNPGILLMTFEMYEWISGCQRGLWSTYVVNTSFFFFFLGFSYEGINSLKGFNVMVAVETNSNPTKKKKEKNLIEF